MSFKDRHLDYNSIKEIESYLGKTKEELVNDTIPENIKKQQLHLEDLTEEEFLSTFKDIMDKNIVVKSFIGKGYHSSHLPSVIRRNILENPSWYTAYTPYQAEISQGRLESLINYQTMITSLTGMEISNASLLDEATATAEAMVMIYNAQKGKNKTNVCLVDSNILPQTLDVLKSRAEGFGIELLVKDTYNTPILNQEILFCAIIPYQNKNGRLLNGKQFPNLLDTPVIITTDLLALTLLKAPATLSDNVEVVVGTTQRFGLPMGFGGAHSAFFATKDKYKRVIPGRIIGESVDSKGNKAYRMALQTREQHIRREKATSNICTSQVLLANISTFYAIYHGAEGLKRIAQRINLYAIELNRILNNTQSAQLNETFFDTLHIRCDSKRFSTLAKNYNYNFNIIDENHISITLDETTTTKDFTNIKEIISILSKTKKELTSTKYFSIPEELERDTQFLDYPVFEKYHTEHEILRYMKRLEKKDISLTDSMISLGSCTMKLNPTTAMMPLSWETVGNIHPFAPKEQTLGYEKMFSNINEIFQNITGFDSFSYQPNSGAQGEYAGLKVIKAYQESIGEGSRNLVLIPSSAHGTNPATAKICGMDIITIKCTENGDIDIEDLKRIVSENKEDVSALMVTYPSTHGVFEEGIVEICEIIHNCGGQVYMDGANLNAQVGLTNPAFIGADVCHMNLHKTFCIPHGGGGPGLGTIGVGKHLTPFLPQHGTNPSDKGVHAIASTHYSSASILTISYAYIKMMGNSLKEATETAILNANYIRTRLEEVGYEILYKGVTGNVAHEMIVDFRPFKEFGIEVVDVAKRLIDYNYHAPTVSFPVVGTLMIEPTESESKEEMDRFCDALINIKKEIEVYPSVLKNAPHTIEDLTDWKYDYSIQKGCFPLDWVKERKYWSPVNRINDSHGDRNLFCTCS
jgi:glycine dehydrogenase